MGKGTKIFSKMKTSPKNDWTPENIKTLVKAYNLTLRQSGTSHAVITNNLGEHLTVPMHKPIKPLYIIRLIKLIEAQDEI